MRKGDPRREPSVTLELSKSSLDRLPKALSTRWEAQGKHFAATEHKASVEVPMEWALLGAAGEGLGYDRWLKANSVKTRAHSLFRQN